MSDVLLAFGGYDGCLAGADNMAWNTAAELDQRGHRVAVLTPSPPPQRRRGVAVVDPATVAPDGRGLPWRPDVVHAFDLARAEVVSLAHSLACAHECTFA